MKRLALRAGRTLALLASAGVLLAAGAARAEPAGRDPRPPSTFVLEASCLYPDDRDLSAPALAVTPDGTEVELWCGSRVEVSRGHCRVRLGGEVTAVPCVTPQGAAGAPRRPGGRSAG